MELRKGAKVRVAGERGLYKIQREELWGDGSVLLYGGDKNPNGIRGFRSVMPDRLVAVKTEKGDAST